jgi:fructose-1,6-bisphosphatase/inositol monophosphatase family enzyme
MIRFAIKQREEGPQNSHNTKSSDADLVTETDVAVEKAIRNRISATFPDHLFIGEESNVSISTRERENKVVWIVDPIDGTTNFVHTFPIVTVSIAVGIGDDLILGVVYNPLTDELWFAWKGCGAFMKRSDGSVIKIHTSKSQSIDTSLISTGFGVPMFRRKTKAVEEQQQALALIEGNTRVLMTRSRDIRRIGGAACDLCYVAMGRADAFFEFGIKEWDIAAGLIIVLEAGGTASTVGGVQPVPLRGRNVLVASTESLRTQLTSLLSDKDINKLLDAIENS